MKSSGSPVTKLGEFNHILDMLSFISGHESEDELISKVVVDAAESSFNPFDRR